MIDEISQLANLEVLYINGMTANALGGLAALAN